MNGKGAIKLTAATAVLTLAIWTPVAAHGGWLVLGIVALTLSGILLFGLWGDVAIGGLVFAVCALVETGARIVTRTPTVAGRAAQLVRRRKAHATAAPSPTP